MPQSLVWATGRTVTHPLPQLRREQRKEEVLLSPEDIWASLFVLQQTFMERLLFAWHYLASSPRTALVPFRAR